MNYEHVWKPGHQRHVWWTGRWCIIHSVRERRFPGRRWRTPSPEENSGAWDSLLRGPGDKVAHVGVEEEIPWLLQSPVWCFGCRATELEYSLFDIRCSIHGQTLLSAGFLGQVSPLKMAGGGVNNQVYSYKIAWGRHNGHSRSLWILPFVETIAVKLKRF